MKQIHPIISLILYFSTFSLPLHGHGFGADTSVILLLHYKASIYGKIIKQRMETAQTLKEIYDNPITRKTQAKSYDERSLAMDYKRVKAAGISTTNCYVRLGLNNDPNNIIECSPIQTFYLVDEQEWIPAYQLESGDLLFSENPQGTQVSGMTLIEKPFRVYTLEVKRFHTFLVGKDRILAHNMLLDPSLFLTLSFAFGEGAVAGGSAGISCGPWTMGAGLALGGVIGIITACSSQDNKFDYHVDFDINQLARNGNTKKPKKDTISTGGSGGNDKDPDDPDDKKIKREWTQPISKQDREDAEKFGYKETKNPPFDSQNRPAFKKGRTWITADRTGHNGGRWKMFNSKGTRIATCDKNLNFIKD